VSRVALVFDEGPGAGIAHRRRMEALVPAFAARGYDVELCPGACEAIAPVVVVDSHEWRADDPSRFSGEVLAAVDDRNRNLDVDVLIEPSPGARSNVHRAARVVLAGVGFALVAPATVSAPADEVRTVLVATGAADVAGHGTRIAAEIKGALPDVSVRLVVRSRDRRTVPPGVDLVDAPNGLAEEFAGADLVVTGGGITLQEALLRGLPTVAVTFTPEHRRPVRALRAEGAAVVADPAKACDEVIALAHDRDRRFALAAAAHAMVDGRGAERVVAEIDRLHLMREKLPA
jgi:spore coat polysaccharide biosynthesis predicted glycosyltransferase SpsG